MKPERITAFSLFSIVLFASLAWGQWKPEVVRQLNGSAAQIKLPGKIQIVTESWNRVVAIPYIVYMPEKDRVLMLVLCDDKLHPMILWSDDHGATWTQPKHLHSDSSGKPDAGSGDAVGLTYLGNGGAVLATGGGLHLWFSNDYGETWGDKTPLPPGPNGEPFYVWDRFFVDSDPSTGRVVRLVETGFTQSEDQDGWSDQGLIRFSPDEGRTWSEAIPVPEWRGICEVVLTRAKNGDLVAACRSDGPRKYQKILGDHASGLGVSISKDNGHTWSKVNLLYNWGRHHPSPVVLANGDIVMSYVVRVGYHRTPEDYPQYGIEAVVSHDNGQTWDLDHRYILTTWKATRSGPNAWFQSSQATSTVLLPDGSLLTAFGTGYRAIASPKARFGEPRDVALVLWKVNTGPVNADKTISNASFDSDLRNKFDPDPQLTKRFPVGRRNIALPEMGARVRASASDEDPSFILYDPYLRKSLTLQTVPAWVEITWPKAHQIEEIRIDPGMPDFSRSVSTECVPLDYRLQYQKDGQWIDLVPPVTGAKLYKDFDPQEGFFSDQEDEFSYVHKFAPLSVGAIRMYITRTSDMGKRGADRRLVPEAKRETILRLVEVFEAKPAR
jgi:hypothetical protein